MRPNDVAQALDLDRIAKDHVWKVEPSCATSGEGEIGDPTPFLAYKSSGTDESFQVSSKVSLGSAKTSRSRRSKRKRKDNNTSLLPFNNQSTFRRRNQPAVQNNRRTGWHRFDQAKPSPLSLRSPDSCPVPFPPYTIPSGLANAPTRKLPESRAGAARAWECMWWSRDWRKRERWRTRKAVENNTTTESWIFDV
jgi:hypothetical protein